MGLQARHNNHKLILVRKQRAARLFARLLFGIIFILGAITATAVCLLVYFATR